MSGNGRLAVENDVVVGGYWFPKQVKPYTSFMYYILQRHWGALLDLLRRLFLSFVQTQFHLCHYAASHDESEFPNAEAFVPERWLRGTHVPSHHHPYSSIPFGVGVRACVGRRVAELEMYFALSRVSSIL